MFKTITNRSLIFQVPIGKKAFLPGTLIHTNDILMSHNNDMFSLMSKHQAQDILNNRSRICDEQLKALDREKTLFENKLNVDGGDVFSEKEIIEQYNEEEEREWRVRHAESVKRFKMEEAKKRNLTSNIQNGSYEEKGVEEDIESILDRFEMLEELSNELECLDDVEDAKEDTELILKNIMMNDSNYNSIKSNSNVMKDSDPNIKEKVEEESKSIKKAKKRKVRFSSSLEDIKLINSRSSDVMNDYVNRTISINFYHSPNKFIQDECIESNTIDNPGQILKLVNLKSILKPHDTIIPEHIPSTNKMSNYDEIKAAEISSYVSELQTIGDVIEHKYCDDNNSIIANEQPLVGRKSKSKFSEMRMKSKIKL
jgi:unconventional prefoldin RPB5 interactor 1